MFNLKMDFQCIAMKTKYKFASKIPVSDNSINKIAFLNFFVCVVAYRSLEIKKKKVSFIVKAS